METPADRPLIRSVLEDFRSSGFRFKELIISLMRSREFPDAGGAVMSQVITKRVQAFAPALAEGLTLPGARIAVGLPPLVAMFNSTGTAYARRPATVAESRSRAASCSGSTATASRSATGFPRETGADYRPDALPRAAGAVPQRHPRAQRPRQSRPRLPARATATTTR